MIKLDVGWVKILEQKIWVFFALALAFGVVSHLFNNGSLTKLSTAFPWIADASLVGCILFGCLSIFSGVNGTFGWIKAKLRKNKAIAKSIENLKHLNHDEHRILSYLVQAKQRSFNCRLDNGHVASLVQKGLLIRAGGTQSILAIPHIVPLHIWNMMLIHEDQFQSADMDEQPPWARHWMNY